MADAPENESSNANSQNLTAGIIIIGDEILKGHTKDVNSDFLVKRFWSLGIKVCKISVVADDEVDIAYEVQTFSHNYTFVITTGGIGPTHDDVTMISIANAFNEKIIKNDHVAELIAQAYGVEINHLNESQMKMAMVPSSAELVYSNDMKKNPYPIIQVHNVYIFPGVPDFMEKHFLGIEHIFGKRANEFHLCKVFLSVDETEIAHVLVDANEKFKTSVQLGSYPVFCKQEYRVKLTLESSSKRVLKAACRYLLDKLPQDSIVSVEGLEESNSTEAKQQKLPCGKEIWSLLKSSNNSNTSACVKGAWAVLQEVLREYTLDDICLSFNGGKDCTVLLYLLQAAVSTLKCYRDTKINALYIRYDSPFPQAEEFIQETTKRYNLNLISVDGDIKSALQGLKISHPNIKAILLGTRRHDPFTERLRTFSCTDPGWPEYMRVNPILDWHHCDVWSVILHFGVPYCSLYDKGYTSLGSTHNTRPNPALRIEGDEEKYKPAYLLEDDRQERAGRT